jgi:hypothetical protein
MSSMGSPSESGHTTDPTPGALSKIPYPKTREAIPAILLLINDEELEEAKFPGGRAYWPDDDTDAIRVDFDWDRDNNRLP